MNNRKISTAKSDEGSRIAYCFIKLSITLCRDDPHDNGRG